MIPWRYAGGLGVPNHRIEVCDQELACFELLWSIAVPGEGSIFELIPASVL
jgi:hypothetical protein